MRPTAGSRRRARLRGPVRISLLLAAGGTVAAGILLGPAAVAVPFAAEASVTPQVQYLMDKVGTTFTFAVRNTGDSQGIAAVEIIRPDSSWKVVGCPKAPAGWSKTRRADALCLYSSTASPADDLAPGTSSPAFQLKATAAGGNFDVTGTWTVLVSQTHKFDDPKLLAAASPTVAGGLDVKVHSFEILDAVVASVAPRAGSRCPESVHEAPAGSTQSIVICGRNRANVTLTPEAGQSSLGGTFIAAPGTFSSGPIPRTRSGSVVLGTWSGAVIAGSGGTGQTVVAQIGASAIQTSPLTTTGTDYEAQNPPPQASAQSVTTNEDTSLPITLGGSDPEDPALTFAVVAGPSHGSLSAIGPADCSAVNTCTAAVTYTPAGDFFGSDSFTFRVSDGTAYSEAAAVAITVEAVNDRPGFTAGGDQTVPEGSGAQAVSPWATAISPGAINEAGQILSFAVTGNDNPGLFSAGPAVASDGTLTYTPAPDANGTANLTVELRDDGGTANGGEDTSAPHSFAITVTSVNAPPSFTPGGDVTVLEDPGAYSAAWAGDISAGPGETGQVVTFKVENDNSALFSVQPAVATDGVLSFTPAGDAFGTATVTVTAVDDGGTANGGDDTSDAQVFAIFVTGVNDEPGFDLPASPDQTAVAGTGPQTVAGFATNVRAGPANEAGQQLTFSVTNDANTLFTPGGQPDIDETTGTLTYEPSATADGMATVSVVLTDDGGTADGGDDTSPARTFTITVVPANHAPTDITLSAESIAENNAPGAVVGTLSTTDPDPGDTHAYSFASGDGDTDNASFIIVGNALSISLPADHETKAAYSIRVGTDDGHGGMYQKALTIAVTDVNEAPTDISLSPSTIAENTPANTVVGTLAAADPDSGESSTYTLSAGGDNAAFNIDGSSLRATNALDHETQDSYTVTVTVADSGGLTYAEDFTITVTDVTEAPTDIWLSSSTIAENSPANTAVGSLATLDPDSGESFTYTLGAGGDNAAFTIDGNWLRATSALDHETQDSYTVTITVADAGGLTYTEDFTITVTDVNEAPTAISLSPSSIAENSPANSVVGTLSATDPDSGQTFVYSLVAGSGDTDNGAFTIGGSSLRANNPLDYEAKSSYSVRVRATDSGTPALSYDQAFTVSVTDVNEDPTDILLSSSTVAENSPAGTVVGTLSSVDPDSGQTFAYSLVAGTGDTDNGAFSIVGETLSIGVVSDYETKAAYSIRARTDDGHGGTYEKAFAIAVTDVNEAPTDISLSSSTIAENSPANTVVGTLSATDPDAADTHTFSLVAGAGDGDNGAFNISGTSLRATNPLDYEAGSSHSVRVRVTDSGSLFYEEAFTITVTDGNDAPTDVILSSSTIAENSPANTVVGTLSATDPDPADTHTFSLVAGAGDGDNGAFNISGTSLRATNPLNYEVGSSLSVRVRATDSGAPALSYEEAFTITVTDVNDPPVAGADTYTGVVGNTLAVVGTVTSEPHVALTGSVLLANDIDEDTGGMPGIVTGTFPTTLGGSVTIGIDGSFRYLPPVGAQGVTDSFSYQVSDGTVTVTGTATLEIGSDRAWYADNAATPGGDGRSTTPFNTLASLSGPGGAGDADASNDVIFLFTGSGPYTGGLVLESGQKLLGQPFGLAFGAATVVPAGGTNPTIEGGVVLAGGVTVQGITAGSTTAGPTPGVALSGASVGASTIGQSTGAQVNVNNPNGGGVSLNGGTPTVVLGPVSSSAGTGISLTGLTGGSFTASGGTVTSSSGPGIVISGGNAPVTIATNIGNATGRSIDIQNRTGGTVTLSGTIGGTSQGIYLANNSLTTAIGVGGAISLETAASPAFTANQAGTVVVTSAGNTLTTTTGTALRVAGTTIGSGGLTFASVSAGTVASGPTHGISLTGVTGGAVAVSGGTVTRATSAGVLIDGGNATVTIATNVDIGIASGRSVDIQNRTGGTVTLSGTISGTSAGIYLNANGASSTVNFTGPITLSTGSSPAFTATSGGMVTVTGAASTLTATAGTGLRVVNTTIGSAGLTFRSINAGTASSGPANGIVLDNTGTLAGLTVTGTGTAGSGGTIQRASGDGVFLASTKNVALSSMAISNNSGSGINGSNVTGLTLASSTVDSNGDDGVADEAGIRFTNLLGTASITATTVSGSVEDNVRIVNTTGVLNPLTISGSTMRDTRTDDPGNDGLLIEADGTASITADVTTSQFLRNRGTGVQVVTNGAGTIDIGLGTTAASSGGTFQDNHTGVAIAHNSSGSLTFRVRNATFSTPGVTNAGPAVNLNKGSLGSGTMSGTVAGNAITNHDSTVGPGIRAYGNGSSGTMTVRVADNNISQVGNYGILVVSRDGTAGQTVNATIENNTVTLASTSALQAISVDAGAITNDATTVCANITGNHATTAGTGLTAIRARQRYSSTFRLQGYTSGLVDAFLTSTNNSATASASGTFSGATCPAP